MENWMVIRSGAGAAAANMALDEALMQFVSQLGQPVLRFYGWNEPAATFGYFQSYVEVAAATALRPLVRRPTGGGIVCHDADWTYSLFFPPAHGWYQLSAVESYRRVHEWVAAALQRVRVPATLAARRRTDRAALCFAGAEQFDVLCGEGKVAGAAQRRNRLGLLIQGSVRAPGGIARAPWEQALCDLGTEQWQVQWEPFDPEQPVLELRDRLVAEKYGRKEYNEKR